MTIDRRVIDASNGMVEYLDFDVASGTVAHGFSGDVEDFIEANRRDALDSDGYGKTRELRHIACIPDLILLKMIERYGADPTAKGNEDLLDRVLADPEWRYLRVDQKPSSRVFWTSPTTSKVVPLAPPASPLILGA